MNWKRGSFERSCLLIAGMVMIVVAATARVTVAQSGGNMERPPHWQVLHPDRNEVVERPFVVMRPGWHIFAGPGALLWDPGSFAAGNFSVTSKMFLFPTSEMGNALWRVSWRQPVRRGMVCVRIVSDPKRRAVPRRPPCGGAGP